MIMGLFDDKVSDSRPGSTQKSSKSTESIHKFDHEFLHVSPELGNTESFRTERRIIIYVN